MFYIRVGFSIRFLFLSFYSHFYNLWSQHAIKNIISFIFSMLTLEVMKEVLEKERKEET